MRLSIILFLLAGLTAAILNVHLVPHTHDDVGWKKTVDEYYAGLNNTIRNAGVQYIIDSVIIGLEGNPERKFIYVEQAFFQRWWREQDTDLQNRVKTLVKNGQLEFINGGWCMHDEATPHYIAMIDQTTLGHQFLKNQFGAVPKVGWQIDPFGHSSTQAALLSAEVGFQALFFARIDWQDKKKRIEDKTMEMIWQASPSYGSTAQVFTGAFVGFYTSPDGFCFDKDCSDPPIMDDPNLEDSNVKERVEAFVNQARIEAAGTAGNDIMFTMGGDFEYHNANTYFKNLDKLIKYVNQDGRVHAMYSTPTIYSNAKINSNITWTVKTDDFFPYSDNPESMWTGYYTSRPALKRYVRTTSNLLNLFRQLEAFSRGNGSITQLLAEADGVVQHHDGVSGTEMQHVAYDYAGLLSKGVQNATVGINRYLATLLKDPNLSLTFCSNLNESVCSISQNNKGFAVVVYNSQARTRTEVIRIPLNDPNVALYNATGKPTPFQVIEVPTTSIPQTETPAPWSLVFLATLPALGYTTYFVQPSLDFSSQIHKFITPTTSNADTVIENSVIRLTFSSTGELTLLENKLNGLSIPLTQNFYYYKSMSNSSQNSGAYIFRPSEQVPTPILTGSPNITIIQGSIIKQVRQVFSSSVSQIISLIGNNSEVEFQYFIGPIPIDDGIGKEIISKFFTNISNNNTWYTDSNGREMLKRIKNYRPTWDYIPAEPVAGNYYPVTTLAYINDVNNLQVTLLTDRSQGFTSLNKGELEFMVHRRCLEDDARGVLEALNETQAITGYPNPVRLGPGLGIIGSHYLLFTSPKQSASQFRPSADNHFNNPYLVFTPIATTSSAISDFIQSHVTEYSFSATPLPSNIQLLTFQPWNNNTILLRLSHQFAIGEDSTLSNITTVDLTTLFKGLTITNALELSLTGNQEISSMKRPHYKVQENYVNDNAQSRRGGVTQFVKERKTGELKAILVQLGPMEIKTFQVVVG